MDHCEHLSAHSHHFWRITDLRIAERRGVPAESLDTCQFQAQGIAAARGVCDRVVTGFPAWAIVHIGREGRRCGFGVGLVSSRACLHLARLARRKVDFVFYLSSFGTYTYLLLFPVSSFLSPRLHAYPCYHNMSQPSCRWLASLLISSGFAFLCDVT